MNHTRICTFFRSALTSFSRPFPSKATENIAQRSTRIPRSSWSGSWTGKCMCVCVLYIYIYIHTHNNTHTYTLTRSLHRRVGAFGKEVLICYSLQSVRAAKRAQKSQGHHAQRKWYHSCTHVHAYMHTHAACIEESGPSCTTEVVSFMHTCTYIHAYTYIHTYIHRPYMRIYVYIYTYTHTYTCSLDRGVGGTMQNGK